jgi:Uma2 family endonuclease
MGVAAEDPVDPTIYPVEDEVGEHEIQTYILELLRPLVARYLAEQGIEAHAGSDQFIYWRQHDPRACVAPDIYVLPGVPQNIAIASWKVWERGVIPDFCIEVVGSRPNKDYDDSPRRHAELGVQELIVFDPFPEEGQASLSVYRHDGSDLRMVEATNGDRVWSQRLDCFVRRIGEDAELRLRLALGPDGDELFATAEEAERAAKEAALRRIAELEAELAKRR